MTYIQRENLNVEICCGNTVLKLLRPVLEDKVENMTKILIKTFGGY
jgi:hypothetical protein